jgi:hypothetical protein
MKMFYLAVQSSRRRSAVLIESGKILGNELAGNALARLVVRRGETQPTHTR